MSLLSGGQAPMTDEAGGGTGDVETEKNSKDSGPLAAGSRHQEGCLCRKGDQSGGQSEVWPWRWVQSAAQSDKEHPYGESARRVELSACLAARCTLVLEILEQRLDGQPSWSLWGKWLPGGR